ncbi:seryl-tRNA synthetase [Capsaspora owczarzaki ATCC 30864]|uniref:serine--tRNA ligase n=1 Tax=Capsaspora owczarzaki (strain ATCC 30864) TaxID=595528 RepID=A0A0D2X0S1_CAPO3|nr:seryl-tRNA synthetase [Capsaspora owczarzaki ATCC 30864]KJE89549.1 seryl-tRNA synthetase [Capsaspora owczarzaki ATCC 30864]|eukprot:XP_004365868.2 seryl-tRNA synthetase [Capsaspora owczarzaki ATCC 30864]
MSSLARWTTRPSSTGAAQWMHAVRSLGTRSALVGAGAGSCTGAAAAKTGVPSQSRWSSSSSSARPPSPPPAQAPQPSSTVHGHDAAAAPFVPPSRSRLTPKLDYAWIAANAETVERHLQLRQMAAVSEDGVPFNAAHFRELFERNRLLQRKSDDLRAMRNKLSATYTKPTGAARPAGAPAGTQKDAANTAADAKVQIAEQARSIKKEIADADAALEEVAAQLFHAAVRVPNDAHPDVANGPNVERVVAVSSRLTAQQETLAASLDARPSLPAHSDPSRIPPTKYKDHVELGLALGLFDLERAAAVTGHAFYFLKGAGALLELALTQLAMQQAMLAGFTPMTTPDVARTEMVAACGFQPRGEMTQVYSLAAPHDRFSLVGTAEIPLAGFLSNTTVATQALPVKLAALSHCFRSETGAHGSDTRGLYRVHQFSKVEMFAFTGPSVADSQAMLDSIVQVQKQIFESLELDFRVLDMPMKELGASAYRKYDIEAWMPGRVAWGEISSASDCTDYQARRLGIRAKAVGGAAPEAKGAHQTDTASQDGNKHLHTVNGTACAIPRTIAALLETHQLEDGSIYLPPALRPFMGNRDRITPEWQQELGALRPIAVNEFVVAKRR